jgi:hypothetical protein
LHFDNTDSNSPGVTSQQLLVLTSRTSIQAQKVVDSFQYPDLNVISRFQEKRITSSPMHGYSSAELKLTTAGTPSTFASASYYGLKAKQRRDELVAKLAAEGKQ